MEINKPTLLSWSLAFLLISFANPVYTWFNPSFVLILSFFFFLLMFFVNKVKVLTKDIFPLVLFFIILSIYTFLPFRPYDNFKLYYIVFLASCYLVFFINHNSLIGFKKVYVNLMVFISIITIISSILFLLKINFPYITIPSETRRDTVVLYFFSIYLDSQVIDMGSYSLYRANGWFIEPGHFGIYLSIALTFLNDIFKTHKGRILLLAMFFTFSATAYFILFSIIFFKYFSLKKMIWLFCFILLCLVVYFVPSINQLVNDFVLLKFQSDSVLNDRTIGAEYLDLNNYSKYIFGNGMEYLDYLKIEVSDYRRFIVTSGYVGFVLFCGFIFYFFYKAVLNRNSYVLLGIMIVTIVFIHRSWMFYFGFIWIYLAILVASFKLSEKQ